MKKRFVIEYLALIPLLGCVFFLLRKQPIPALIFYALWYFLFGFVGLASYCHTKQKLRLSKFFLAITTPILLVPFRKAFYYWLKAIHALMKDTENVKIPFALAKKVNPEHLYTDHNRCMFYSFLAALYIDMGDKQTGHAVFEKAEQTPHKPEFDAQLASFREQFFPNSASEEPHAGSDLTL